LVITVRSTTVFDVFTRSKYSRLVEYEGRYTSRGPSGNQPMLLPPPPLTNATSAGA
jgi:hypothetical protein